ncbi:putative S-adenosyl-L-methionine-dependent methyltransferase [Lyophyllum shimeji]|uniref:S-adenosyl-L-methionine-dependent methyltransferase n=1 Tax=Lyophyllum shimeji TaxID=47721 RepID=A0A9P3PNL6_LYOSH|nr:putative S-adenosyl-L-methionine-dependent methyltransferase [Lyophyllum shimeji]
MSRPEAAAVAEYILPRDETERDRLEVQHRLIVSLYDGDVVLPVYKPSPGDHILDCGTGTGIWILELAKSYPSSVTFTGIDISSHHFPSAPPSNTSFEVRSILNIPDEWKNKFSLVHQRLLILGLKAEHWPTTLQIIHRITKPGGCIQLGELGKVISGPATARLESMNSAWFSKHGFLRDCVERIPSMLEALGFVDIDVRKVLMPVGRWAGQKGVLGQNNFMRSYKGALKRGFLRDGGYGVIRNEAEMDALLEAVKQEWDVTEGSGVEYFTFVARKPKTE